MEIMEGFGLGRVCACVLLATGCVVPSQGTTSFSIQAFEAGSISYPRVVTPAAEAPATAAAVFSQPVEVPLEDGASPWSIPSPSSVQRPDLGLSNLQRPLHTPLPVPPAFASAQPEDSEEWPTSPFEPMNVSVPIDLGSGLSVRVFAASELQEKDTLGFWNDFHTESLEEEQLNLSWAYRRRPGVSWVGRVGMPRVVDRTIDQSLLKPGTVFATFGLQWSF